jgi:hypothetical protein
MSADPDERWILCRGRREPCVYPFRSEAEALDFALDHGMIDWRAERSDDPEKEHEEICARCREPWPCAHIRLDRETAWLLRVAKDACHRCGKSAGWHVKVPGGGHIGEDVRYHARKGACRNMAMRELARLGHAELLAAFECDIREHDERLARQRVWRAAHREAIGLGMSRGDALRHRSEALARHDALAAGMLTAATSDQDAHGR